MIVFKQSRSYMSDNRIIYLSSMEAIWKQYGVKKTTQASKNNLLKKPFYKSTRNNLWGGRKRECIELECCKEIDIMF